MRAVGTIDVQIFRLAACLTRGAGLASGGQKVTVVWKCQGQLASDP